jgi:Tfp pilus assembly protein PilO
MNLSSNKLINLGIVAAIAIVALAGWFIGIAPLNDQVASARATEQTIATANSTSAARLILLKKQFANMGLLQGQLDQLATSVPADAGVPSFLAEINGLTTASGATLVNLTVSDAAVYVAPTTTPGTAPAATTDATATPAPSDSAAAAPTATGAAPTVAGATTRLIVIPVRVTVGGSYASVMAFAAALQGGPRLLLVSDLSMTQSESDGSFTGIVDGSIYALPPAGGTAAAATDTATPTQTPAPSTTPTPSSTVSAKPSGTPSSTPTPTGTAKP